MSSSESVTTVQVGRIQGGMARNVVAGQCEVEWEIRTVRHEDGEFIKTALHAFVEDELKPEMRCIAPDAHVVTHTIGEVEGLQVVSSSEARDLVFELTAASDAEVVAFGTEAGLFQACGISTVICGPGSIAQAHKPDEYIEVAQLQAGIAMIESLLQRMSR